MKKTLKNKIILILSLIFIITLIPTKTYGKEESKKNKPPYINARCAIAIDKDTGIVLFEKSANEIVPIASTTKIMTTLVALKYGDLDRKIEISANADKIKGSTVGYKKGEKITLRELLYGLMLRSGNDAAIAIAEGIAGSVEDFSKLMNEYASEIGLLNSHFVTPHGLDKDEHYSTAYDLALATAAAKKHELFNQIVSSKDVKKEEFNFTRDYHNINKILWKIPEADGVKTGYTGKAGKCLVTSSKVNGNDIIIVVLNCTPRWDETTKIHDFVKNNYDFKKICTKGDVLDQAVFEEGSVNIISDKDIIIPFKNGIDYSIKINKPKELNWKVKKGEDFGSLSILNGNELIYTKKLKAGNNLSKGGIKNWFLNKKKCNSDK
ncbi:D-alanyl-D-alanine carboxypeptidase family protein [Clostridium sp. FAM 1755]|uniref:serine-type D-Ala-D-Ala carboxypeptidase n=1 Tax=Clostridium botulinum TaxID=1491 RepID=A0A6M0T0M3_CLOBO|nr:MULTISPECIES: D-alanyl-D-alanine carboxypeptidase family protein [Clostridium]NFA61317.1 D-alanyl-D-alanine carboxypeptidase [Clostridium botulinum]KOR24420.1 D-alanyl-D-alanine carboxypeptidase [Clostridium sp. L74]NFI74963.1 D-alanyl-D-alanine carboxypeptidase [Clostridium sporogenes]NFL73848.1 D-alanyl-D-alanine carboxypeptidase [Clostridium sporogenes]NFM25996.1 D-alanyl-D-alanine carboxypeptidase [Clostridium sporogenes]